MALDCTVEKQTAGAWPPHNSHNPGPSVDLDKRGREISELCLNSYTEALIRYTAKPMSLLTNSVSGEGRRREPLPYYHVAPNGRPLWSKVTFS